MMTSSPSRQAHQPPPPPQPPFGGAHRLPPQPAPSDWQPTPAEGQWIAYTPEAFSERLGKDNLVLDFTADWCPTCKLLERTVLTPPRLTEWERRHKVVFMKVDLTRQTPPAMALLRALGSQSIPVAAFFPAGEQATRPLVLRDLFTASQFEQAMDEAFGPPHALPAANGE